MATKTFTALTAVTTLAAGDELVQWNAAAGAARKITVANFIAYSPNGGLAELGVANVFTTNQRINGLLGINKAPTTGQQISVLGNATTTIPIVADTPAAQSANLLELRNNTTQKFAVYSTGVIAQRAGQFTVGENGGTVSVSTSPTTIVTFGVRFALIMVTGKAAGDRFCDLVLLMAYGGTKTVISSHVFGSPAARTYGEASGTLTLAMASGTYDVQAVLLSRIAD